MTRWMLGVQVLYFKRIENGLYDVINNQTINRQRVFFVGLKKKRKHDYMRYQ